MIVSRLGGRGSVSSELALFWCEYNFVACKYSQPIQQKLGVFFVFGVRNSTKLRNQGMAWKLLIFRIRNYS